MSDQEGVIFEIIRIGSYAKVVAVDTQTGFEVSVVGPARGYDTLLKRTALMKLYRMMGREL